MIGKANHYDEIFDGGSNEMTTVVRFDGCDSQSSCVVVVAVAHERARTHCAIHVRHSFLKACLSRIYIISYSHCARHESCVGNLWFGIDIKAARIKHDWVSIFVWHVMINWIPIDFQRRSNGAVGISLLKHERTCRHAFSGLYQVKKLPSNENETNCEIHNVWIPHSIVDNRYFDYIARYYSNVWWCLLLFRHYF